MRSRLFHHGAHSARRKGLIQGAAQSDRVPHRVMHGGGGGGVSTGVEGEPPTQPGGSKIKE